MNRSLNERADGEHDEGNHPRDDALHRDDPDHPFGAQLPAHRRHRRDARRVKQAERQKSRRRNRRKHRREGGTGIQGAQHRHDTFLSQKARNQRRHHLPAAIAHRRKNRREHPGDNRENAAVHIGRRHHVQRRVEGTQEPDHDVGDQHDRKGALNEICSLIPHQPADIFDPRHPIIGQLHDKGHRFACERRVLEHRRRQDTDRDAEHVQ